MWPSKSIRERLYFQIYDQIYKWTDHLHKMYPRHEKFDQLQLIDSDLKLYLNAFFSQKKYFFKTFEQN